MRTTSLRLRLVEVGCALSVATTLILIGVLGDTQVAQAAGQSGSKFKALGPDKAQGGDDALFFPNDFEAAVASQPQPNALTFFSLCRRAPLLMTAFYSSVSPRK